MTALVAGLAGVSLEPDEYELRSGARFSRTYAHMMAHFMMAYSPAEAGKPHPAPWSAVHGGAFTYDIEVQLEVPESGAQEPKFTAWWLTAMLRLRLGPAFLAPVLGEQAFSNAKQNPHTARFYPAEIHPRILELDPHPRRCITELDLAWLDRHWLEASQLFLKNDLFQMLFQSVDQSMFASDRNLGLLLLWGGLEAVFSPAKSELRYRISSSLASYLESPGLARMQAQRNIAKLYDSRSAAAHGRVDKKQDSLTASYGLAKKALLKIIEENHVPTTAELEAKLFGAESE